MTVYDSWVHLQTDEGLSLMEFSKALDKGASKLAEIMTQPTGNLGDWRKAL
ncbi:MAG: hypothetical protein V2I33_17780 [Kangiellaceae bacterium]|jgi:hypothetical protein|nr:hypothetical protein [Kangiellaceae bacterium]